VPSRGADPCYISFDKTGKFVLVANYTGGNVAVFPIQPDGRLGEAIGFVQHTGSGPNTIARKALTPLIEVTPDNRYAIVADLGLTNSWSTALMPRKVYLLPTTHPSPKLHPAPPRHVAFHPNGERAYVIDEMVGAVSTFSLDSKKGALHLLQTVPTLPARFLGREHHR